MILSTDEASLPRPAVPRQPQRSQVVPATAVMVAEPKVETVATALVATAWTQTRRDARVRPRLPPGNLRPTAVEQRSRWRRSPIRCLTPHPVRSRERGLREEAGDGLEPRRDDGHAHPPGGRDVPQRRGVHGDRRRRPVSGSPSPTTNTTRRRYPSGYGPFTLGDWIESVDASQDYELTIELTQQFAPFLRNLAMFASAVLSKAQIESLGDSQADLGSEPEDRSASLFTLI